MTLFSILTFLASTSFASNFGSELENSVRKNDFPGVQKLIGNQTSPFAPNSGLTKLLNDRPNVYNQPDRLGRYVLDIAVGAENEHTARQTMCNPHIINLLLEKGAVPSKRTLVSVSKEPCLESLRPVANKLTTEDVANSGIEFMNYMISKYGRMKSDEQEIIVEHLTKLADVTKYYLSLAQKNCSSDDKVAPWCKVKALGDSFKRSIQNTQSEEENEDSPETLGTNACLLQAQIDEASSRIERQNRIGKESGVVDQSILYSAGARIVKLKDELSAVKVKYGKVSSKDWSPKSCKTKNN